MEGVFEVNVFDLLLTEIKPTNRLPSGAGRKENWRAKLGLESFFCPPGHDDFLCRPVHLHWLACVQATPPSPSPIITEESGGLHTGSTWEHVCRLTEEVPLLYNHHIREHLTIYSSSPNELWVNSPWGWRPNGLLIQSERGIVVLVKSN